MAQEIVLERLTIGQVARRAGLSVQTIRYYEREGLLPAPERRPSGYRAYPEGVVRRLLFIRRAKELGFSLREIKELLALRVDPTCTCGEVKVRALAKVTDVDRKIAVLRRIRGALLDLAEACPGGETTADCPILEALDSSQEMETILEEQTR